LKIQPPRGWYVLRGLRRSNNIYFEEYLTHNSPSIHDFYILIDQIHWAEAFFRRMIKRDVMEGQTDRQKLGIVTYHTVPLGKPG
jgi:hypothetical protein